MTPAMTDDADENGADDPAMEFSPLSGEVTQDGITVDVAIYRIVGDEWWILEVMDEDDTSTLWDAPFPTAQEALDEFQRTVAEEGIGVFMGSPSDPTQ